jgi:DNA-directed RNA polymerase alpha subunit
MENNNQNLEQKKKDLMNQRTIDCSDLIGTYTLDEMPNLLKKIQSKIDKVKNTELIYVKEVGLSERLKNSLLRADFDTLNEVTTQTRKQILELNGIGRKCLNELEEVMDDYRLYLRR